MTTKGLSPFLFIIVMEKIMQRIERKCISNTEGWNQCSFQNAYLRMNNRRLETNIKIRNDEF